MRPSPRCGSRGWRRWTASSPACSLLATWPWCAVPVVLGTLVIRGDTYVSGEMLGVLIILELGPEAHCGRRIPALPLRLSQRITRGYWASLSLISD